MDSETEWVNKDGLMAPFMKENGNWVKQTAMESYITQMVTFMKATGLTIKQMEKEPTLTLMAPSMLVNGKTTNNMVLDLKPGQTELFMKGFTLRVKSMVRENLHLQMAQFIRVSSI